AALNARMCGQRECAPGQHQPLSRCASGSRSTDKPVSTTYSKTAALLDYDGNIFARDVFTSVRALLFRDAVAPYFHPRLAWATSKVNTPSGWPGRTSTSCDLTVGGRAELRLAGMGADGVASVLDKEA